MGRRFDGVAPTVFNALARLQEVWTSVRPRELTSRWYLPIGATSVSTTATALAAGKIALVPVFLPRGGTIGSVGFRTTAIAAATTAQVVLYAHDPASGRPTGAPLASSANISISTAAAVITAALASPPALAAGWYWLGITVAASVTFQCFDTISNDYASAIGCSTAALAIGTAGTVNSVTVPNTFGTALTISTSTALTEVTTPATPAMAYQLSTAASS